MTCHKKLSLLRHRLKDIVLENRRLAAKIESLRSNSLPVVTITMLELVSRLNIATVDRQLNAREAETLCDIMFDAQHARTLVSFLEHHDWRSGDLAFCVDGIIKGDEFPLAFYGEYGTNCEAHIGTPRTCVCVMKREFGWIITNRHRRF